MACCFDFFPPKLGEKVTPCRDLSFTLLGKHKGSEDTNNHDEPLIGSWKNVAGSWGAVTFREVYTEKAKFFPLSPSSERIEAGDLEIRLSPSKNVSRDLM